MKINIDQGYLIVFDGPNGVGKSTLIKNLEKLLLQNNYKVYCTKEPTVSELGEFLRKEAEIISGNALACMVAADRYYHLENEIIPKIQEGYIVISDRYLLSSLILQCMDGVSEQFVLDINQDVLKPDLQVILTADEDILQKRLGERDYLTRFEKDNQSKRELEYTISGALIMEQHNVGVLYINNNEGIEKNGKLIYEKILQIIKEK